MCILGVAVKLADGRTFALPEPYRHHHVLWWIGNEECPPGIPPSGVIEEPENWVPGSVQGFVDGHGFLTREEAYALACESGQLLPENKVSYTPGLLFSEDLW